MSDQNQWPKPGEQQGSDDAQQGQNPYTAPSQQQYPGTGHQAPGQHQGQQQHPYAAPQGQDPSGQQSQNPYAQPSNPHGQQPQNPYGQQPSNPYGQQTQNPYGQQTQNPYGQQTQNPYAQQPANPYAAPYASTGYQPYAQRPKTNTLAILSIVFAYAGIIIWPLVILTSPAGAIMGHIALGKIKQTGEGGRGLALAGVIGGWVLTGLYVLIVGIVIIVGITAGNSDPYGYDYGSGALIG